jgi:aryl-alcohol dehydrogenase-like predicted oxidoreductase
MEHKRRELGRTGIRVFPIGLGAMPLSLQGRPDERTAISVIHAAIDAGVDFIDTANTYCLDDRDIGHNERLIAKALKTHPSGSKITVATKGGMTRPAGSWGTDGRPAKLRAACEQSLKALEVETITLYQFHWPDGRVPFLESVGELARLKQEGKIRHVGLSNVTLEQLAAAQRIVRIESVQNECNPSRARDARSGFIRACAQQGISYIAYSPVGGHFGHRQLARQPVLARLARAHGVSPQGIALAWLLSLGENVLPIPGASKAASIIDSARSVSIALSSEELRQIATIRQGMEP